MKTQATAIGEHAKASTDMARSGPLPLQRQCACGGHSHGAGECESCAKKKTMQRQAVNGNGSSAAGGSLFAHAEASASAGGGMRGGGSGGGVDLSATPTHSMEHRGGRPLDSSLAAHYRPWLGAVTERVRLHDGPSGNSTARREGAVAVTSGTDIYFAAGALQPHTHTGRHLLSHELAHVWQQHRPDGPPSGYSSTPGDRYEQEANRMADREGAAAPASPTLHHRGGIRMRRTDAEQIATVIRHAVVGLGTDEDAIFQALTGRTLPEIAAIDTAYQALSGGTTLEAALEDEMSGDELSRALSLLHGETPETEVARRLWDAVRGLGTDEESIFAAVAGRTQEQWTAIQDAYRTMAHESLLSRLQQELNDDEWAHLQSMLPGVGGGAVTPQDRATVIANQLEAAMAGLGTDEDAIYAALTGRSDSELRDIEGRFRLITGHTLDARLREELNASDYARADELLHPSADPTERLAKTLRIAVEGPGTDESTIIAILTGRRQADILAIRAAYERLYHEALSTRLREELSGPDWVEVNRLLTDGHLDPEDEIYVSVKGAGTDEERLFAVLRDLHATPPLIVPTINAYAAKGYGDMLEDIRGDLSFSDFDRAMELLHGAGRATPSCSTDQRDTGLEAISEATSLAQNAAGLLGSDITAGALSKKVRNGLGKFFNPAGVAGAVTIAVATQVRLILNQARNDLLTANTVTCTTPVPMPCGVADPCVANPSCSTSNVSAWTCAPASSLVRLCPNFFECDQDKTATMLHEFIHHTGVADQFYVHQTAGFSGLSPNFTGGPTDSLNNADSYTHFAKEAS